MTGVGAIRTGAGAASTAAGLVAVAAATGAKRVGLAAAKLVATAVAKLVAMVAGRTLARNGGGGGSLRHRPSSVQPTVHVPTTRRGVCQQGGRKGNPAVANGH